MKLFLLATIATFLFLTACTSAPVKNIGEPACIDGIDEGSLFQRDYDLFRHIPGESAPYACASIQYGCRNGQIVELKNRITNGACT